MSIIKRHIRIFGDTPIQIFKSLFWLVSMTILTLILGWSLVLNTFNVFQHNDVTGLILVMLLWVMFVFVAWISYLGWKVHIVEGSKDKKQ